MKQLICRLEEDKIAALMDEFVGGIQDAVAIEEALVPRLTRPQLEALQADPANHHHLRLTFECGHTQTCRCREPKTHYYVEGTCPGCRMGLHESSDAGDTKRVGVVAVFKRVGGKLKVLMGKRDYDPEAGKYALPGGHVKEGETTEDGARREIKEETGITVEKLKQLRVRPGDAKETVTIYGTLYTGDEKAEADDETGAVRWMDVANLPDGLAWDNNELIPKLAKEMELGVLEADEINAKRFILNTPTFTLKQTSFSGWQVFVNTSHAGPWPQPIGTVEQDPEGRWFIVMGRKLDIGDRWAWWDTGWEKGENGGVNGPRFDTKEQAALEVWHNYRKAMHNRPVKFPQH